MTRKIWLAKEGECHNLMRQHSHLVEGARDIGIGDNPVQEVPLGDRVYSRCYEPVAETSNNCKSGTPSTHRTSILFMSTKCPHVCRALFMAQSRSIAAQTRSCALCRSCRNFPAMRPDPRAVKYLLGSFCCHLVSFSKTLRMRRRATSRSLSGSEWKCSGLFKHGRGVACVEADVQG